MRQTWVAEQILGRGRETEWQILHVGVNKDWRRDYFGATSPGLNTEAGRMSAD